MACIIFDDTNSFPQTAWNGLNCSENADAILIVYPLMQSGMCGPFSANSTGSNGTCYTSTLTVTASAELNGSVVNCFNNNGNGVLIGSALLIVLGKKH